MLTAHRTALTVLLILFVAVVSPAQTRGGARSRRPAPTGAVTRQPKQPQSECREFNHNYAITTKYDRFADETTVRLVMKPVEERTAIADLYFYFTYPGQRFLNPPSAVKFVVEEYSSPSKGTFTSLVILTNKDRLTGTMRTNYTRDPIVNGWLAEHVISFPYRNFLQLTRSESTEMRVGSSELRLSEDMLEAIRDFACHTNPHATFEPASKSNQQSVQTQSASLLEGTWVLTVQAAQGLPQQVWTLTIEKSGGGYSAVTSSPDGTGNFPKVIVEGNSFSASDSELKDGQRVAVTLAGSVEANRMNGTLTVGIQNGASITLPFTGVRKQ
jgi:hypothetical protein